MPYIVGLELYSSQNKDMYLHLDVIESLAALIQALLIIAQCHYFRLTQCSILRLNLYVRYSLCTIKNPCRLAHVLQVVVKVGSTVLLFT